MNAKTFLSALLVPVLCLALVACDEVVVENADTTAPANVGTDRGLAADAAPTDGAKPACSMCEIGTAGGAVAVDVTGDLAEAACSDAACEMKPECGTAECTEDGAEQCEDAACELVEKDCGGCKDTPTEAKD